MLRGVDQIVQWRTPFRDNFIFVKMDFASVPIPLLCEIFCRELKGFHSMEIIIPHISGYHMIHWSNPLMMNKTLKQTLVKTCHLSLILNIYGLEAWLLTIQLMVLQK